MSEEGRKKGYPFLEQMSLEELKQLLVQEAAPSDGSRANVEFIMAIMGVIGEKDNHWHSPADKEETAAAWKDFQENYQGQAESYYTARPLNPDSSTYLFELKQSPAEKRKRKLKIAGVVAAAIVLLCGTASALGVNVVQALAHWTAETFGFATPSGLAQEPADEAVQEDPYRSLRVAVADLTDLSVVPNWWPDGTRLIDNITVTERLDSTRIQGIYEMDQGQFTINIRIYEDVPESYMGVYEKDDRFLQRYESGGIIHYIMSNNKRYEINWTNDKLECHVQGDLSVEDLEKMVDSIYEE